MQAIQSYHDLCKEIEVLELRADSLEEEASMIRKKMHASPPIRLVASYDGMPKSQTDREPLDVLWKRHAKIQEALSELYDIIEMKCRYKMKMEKRMGEFEGLEYKVAYMRDVKNMPLFQIAQELDYSYEWIRKVSARVKRIRPTA